MTAPLAIKEQNGFRLIDGGDIQKIIDAVNGLATGTTTGVYTGTFDGVVGGVTPAAGTFTTLNSTGATSLGATTLTSSSITGNASTSGYNLASVGNALTAAGTNRATALVIAKEINNITTATASTGALLPVGVVGMRITVFNGGASAITVYANGSETIDGTAGATGVALTNAKRCIYEFTAANTWISAQLGVVSA